MSSRTTRALVAFAVIAVLAAVAAAGCGSSGDSDAARDAAVLNAIGILDGAGLHAIDDSINDDKTIPADARTVALKLQAVTALTEWPKELSTQADALERIFAEMVTALSGDKPDVARAGEAAAKAHDAQHEFSGKVWAHLYEEAGIKVEGAGVH